MRALLIEDEQPTLELMKMVIKKNKNLEIVGKFTNPEEVLENIVSISPDVIFMDIEMPYMNGVDLAREVLKLDENIQIVFVTAYEKYAVGAFQVNAVNYILKPIMEVDLNITVNRLLKNYSLRKNTSLLSKQNQIFSLGNFKVYGYAGSEVRWPTAKVKELFAYFIYRNGEEIDKWKLCDILWPDSPPKKAEHSLHSAIYRLKSALKNAGIEDIVRYENGKYRIKLEKFYCDAWEFESFIKDNPSVGKENVINYKRIIDIYKGRMFEDAHYFWAMELNEKFEGYYLRSMKNLTKFYMKNKLYSNGEEYLRKVIKRDPFDEEAHELLMQIYFYLRDKVKLVSHYNSLSALFKEELNIEPKESTKKLYKILLMKL